MAMTEQFGKAEAWDVFSPWLASHCLYPERERVQTALYTLENRVRERERPTAAEISEARNALGSARAQLEETFAVVAEDADPWGNGVSSHAPYGALVEQLEDAGYVVLHEDDTPAFGEPTTIQTNYD